MVDSLRDIVYNIQRKTNILTDDVVVDIGCNDGIMLSMFPKCYKVGVDPASNLQDEASKNCNLFINDYFDERVLFRLPDKAKIITSIAMFYDLEDPNSFVQAVKQMLKIYGIWVIQLTDLLSMFRINAFDNIVHEHLEYYSLRTLSTLLNRHGLEIFDVQYNDVNGGSIRAFVGHTRFWEVKDRVKIALKAEDDYMNSFVDPFLAFKERSEKIKNDITTFIRNARFAGKSVYALGASTKGNTLLQYFGLTGDDIQGIGEINPDKYGLRTIGSHIPILPEAEVLSRNPDFCLVLPWHFKSTFMDKCGEYLTLGGRLIIPCPEPTIITAGGVIWI